MTTALYRRYRPDTFADLIGQSHVTDPLVQALRADRISHAYLFSGPRGCGKTTSARILARCLNCAQGPTPEPCGQCDSCVELATGGPGSLDVVEIDAASHGGVDDARELRERATFAPARDRFKIFILDEAHMVTSQGFNALLKIVEEPPPHIKFIFATTEPDKVIGTIRSRTHHYPFRLVAPADLVPYLGRLLESEGVRVGDGVLPLVVRAGGGSVRDSLSVLDQLLAGAGAEGIDYEHAVALLGYTHATLLDDVVEAIAARDGAAAFRVVDRVVTTGHEPRRFVEDLLERLRDLIVIAASGDAARAVFRDLPVDQFDRMVAQAATLGASELSRSADLANQALTEMHGATSPRLHLELLAARLLLPAVTDDAGGLGARLDRVERTLDSGVAVPTAPRVPAAPKVPAAPQVPAAPEPAVAPDPAPQATPQPGPEAPAASPPIVESTPTPTPTPEPEPEQAAPAPTGAALEAEVLRRRWPEVLQTLRGLRLATWVLVSQNAQVMSLDDTTVRLGFTTPQLASTFRSGPHAEQVARALHETLGLGVRVEAVADEQQRGGGRERGARGPGAQDAEPGRRSAPAWGTPAAEEPSEPVPPGPAAPAQPPAEGAPSAAVAVQRDEAPPPWDEEPPGDPEEPDELPAEPVGRPPTPPRLRVGPGAKPVFGRSPGGARPAEEIDASPDDPDVAQSGLVGAPLVAQMLGGTVIDEIPEDSATPPVG